MKKLINNIDKKLIPNILENNKYIILDVDRTIINGTAWFKACSTPNLLIDEKEREHFLHLNSQAYEFKTISLEYFRKETLALIERKLREDNMINNQSKPVFSLNLLENIFYNSARLVVKKLFYYKECIEYIKELKEIYGEELQVVFLSSGYRCFIHGVVDYFFDNYFEQHINYYILGSEIDITTEGIEEAFFMSQDMKQKVVEHLILKGANIIMIADDSVENPDLFDLVKKCGGDALIIDYKKDQLCSTVWKEALKTIQKEKLLEFYRRFNTRTILLEDRVDNQFINYLSKQTNSVGIATISVEEYKNWIEIIKDNTTKDIYLSIKKALDGLFLKKNEIVYLRGKLYYYWLPENNNKLSNYMSDNYKKLTQVLYQLRNIFKDVNLFEKSNNSYITRIIFLSILEHMQNIHLVVINMLEKAEIHMNKIISSNKELNCLVQKITNLIFQILEDKFDYYFFIKTIEQIDFNLLNTLFDNYFVYHQGMREQDNIVSIYRSVKLISSNSAKIDFDYVIPFFYGGSELGYSIVAFLQVNEITQKIPRLMNCHYSSKKEHRLGKKYEVDTFISKTYYGYLKEIRDGNLKLLLFDNNSTTFRTLMDSRTYFEKYNNSVYSAVVSFNYNNLVDYLMDNKPYESVVDGWGNLLDYGIVEEYITAFDTWGTSEKGEYLKEIYI
ncbi:MAG: hypothetical protein WCQ54_00865 [Clostridiaceae bacterium]